MDGPVAQLGRATERGSKLINPWIKCTEWILLVLGSKPKIINLAKIPAGPSIFYKKIILRIITENISLLNIYFIFILGYHNREGCLRKIEKLAF